MIDIIRTHVQICGYYHDTLSGILYVPRGWVMYMRYDYRRRGVKNPPFVKVCP